MPLSRTINIDILTKLTDNNGQKQTAVLAAVAAEKRKRESELRGIADAAKVQRMETTAEAASASGEELFGARRRDALRAALQKTQEPRIMTPSPSCTSTEHIC